MCASSGDEFLLIAYSDPDIAARLVGVVDDVMDKLVAVGWNHAAQA